MIKKLLTSLSLVLLITSCDSDGDSSLLQFINSSQDLTTLSTLISYVDVNGEQVDSADLSILLSNVDQEFTLFVPDDTAFDELDQTQDGIFNNLDLEVLENILGAAELANAFYITLANHVLDQPIRSFEFLNNQSLTTVAEQITDNSNLYGLSVDANDGLVIVPTYTLSAANIIEADIETTNGVAHIIGKVLLDDALADALELPQD